MGSVLAAGPKGLLLPGHVSSSPSPLFQSPPGLIGYWGFDADCLDFTQGLAFDLSGNGNSGTLSSGQSLSTGPVGNALAFDGTGSVALGSKNYVSPSLPFTVSAWALATTYGPGQFPALVKLQDASGNPWEIFYSNYNASGFNYVGINIGASAGWVTGLFQIADLITGWHLVTVTYNGGGQATLSNFTLYFDGVPQTLIAGSGFGGVVNANMIGDDGGGDQWYGSIDEVRVYNRALAPWEVIALYKAGLQGRREVLL